MAVDAGTIFLTDLLWARILIKVGDSVLTSSIKVVMGSKSFNLQLWWEIPPCIGLLIV